MRRGKKFKRIIVPVGGEQKGAGTEKQSPETSTRAHNVVDALYKHFAKWHPHILKDSPQNQEPDKNAS